jgi:glycosyltransferase involved in cell wall biosynthesis
MKIVHVLPPLTKGGGERIAVELANHIAKEGHEVTILAAYPVDPSLLQNAINTSVNLRFVSLKKGKKYLAMLAWLRKNRKWLFEQDILHCHLTYGAVFGTLVYMMRKVGKIKKPLVIETYHAVGMLIPTKQQWMHARLAEKRDALILMAEDRFWKGFVKEHPKILTEVIPNGISINWTEINENQKNRYKEQLRIPSDCRFVVGTVGMLRSDRQPWRYIPIFAQVVKELGKDVHFVIAGSGPEFENLTRIVHEFNLEQQVHFAGLVENPLLPFSIMDLYISLGVGSTAGVSMFEAALAGLPVIAIQLQEGYETKDTDWFWSGNSDQQIALKIVELLNSPDLRSEMSARQNNYVKQNHSTEVMVTSYQSIYESMLHATEHL